MVKTAKEYLKDLFEEPIDLEKGGIEDNFLQIITQVQLDAIEATVKLCAEKAKAEVKTVWEGNTGSEYCDTYAVINKDSILNCLEILKKEL